MATLYFETKAKAIKFMKSNPSLNVYGVNRAEPAGKYDLAEGEISRPAYFAEHDGKSWGIYVTYHRPHGSKGPQSGMITEDHFKR